MTSWSVQRQQSLQWLAQGIARDGRFATAAVHTMFTALTGREPLRPPSQVATDDDRARLAAFDAQDQVFRAATDRFLAGNANLKTVIKSLVLSPYYRAVRDTAGSSDAKLANIGTGRLLPPEQLHRKIIAVTGLPWVRSGRNVLLNTAEFRIFYGGIDSNQITQRITQPNGIMASIALRMANEMACQATAKDFLLPADDRRLFPLTELSFVPRDNNGFAIPAAEQSIRGNIVHLHRRVLGEVLAPTDPEIDRTYQLFVDTWLEGQAGLREGVYSVNLSGECQATRDPNTNDLLPTDERITTDREYVVRAWMAVMTYMLSDYAFLYE